MRAPAGKTRPTVAVVAVHGVADQTPGSSVHAIGNLLLQANGRRYTPAHEITLHIPTAPAIPPAGEVPPRETLFEDDVPKPEPNLRPSAVHSPRAAPDHQLMRRQLRWYGGSGAPYSTLRLETQRLGEAGLPAVDVHIYEMYWADLSRLGSGVLRFFSELYQLLFHTATLGSQTLQHAALEHGPTARAGMKLSLASRVHQAVDRVLWRCLILAHKWSVRMLTIVIPTLALVILTVGSTASVFLIFGEWQIPVAIALPGAVLAFGLAYYIYRRGTASGFTWWTLCSAGLIALVIWGVRMVLGWREALLPVLLAAEWLALAGLVLFLLLRVYDRHRPGARWVGMVQYLAAIVVLGIWWFGTVPGDPGSSNLSRVGAHATRAVLWTVEQFYLLGILYWLGLFALGACTWILGFCTWVVGKIAVQLASRERHAGSSVEEAKAIADRAARAVRTSRLTLALPAAAFIVVTTMLWWVVVKATMAMLEQSSPRQPSSPRVLELEHCPFVGGGCTTVERVLDKLLEGITGLGLPLAGLLLVIGLGLLLWWLVPIAVSETRPPKKPGDMEISRRMGEWLSGGLGYAFAWMTGLVAFATVLGFALFVGSFLMFLFGELPAGPWPSSWLEELIPPAKTMIDVVGGFLVAGAIGVLALRQGRLEALSRAARPVLDVILDVDGYLREHPRGGTPRARIAERYVSLLRYLCAWRNPLAQHRSYQAIVIVAHSQGAVITTDLLGFLQREHDPSLDAITRDSVYPGAGPAIPIYLFTMGCPLRQLYEEFFPHLYSWVKRRPAAWQHVDLVRPGTGAVPGPPAGVFATNPDPSGIRVDRWVNAYRTGDYVGRDLWLENGDSKRFCPGSRHDPLAVRWEICIGAGAHTHYWNSDDIARELDNLIRI